LKIKDRKVESLELNFVESSFYGDYDFFSKGSIEYDHALLMRDVAHDWHGAPSYEIK
jgi:hypothetical protein